MSEMSSEQIRDLIGRLQGLYDAATTNRSKRWWSGGFGWMKPGAVAEEAITPTAQDFIVTAHNAMPDLLALVSALVAERDGLRETVRRVTTALGALYDDGMEQPIVEEFIMGSDAYGSALDWAEQRVRAALGNAQSGDETPGGEQA